MFDIYKNIVKCSLKTVEEDICPCSLEGVMKYLGKPWTILLIGVLGNHSRLRYNEIQKKLGNINPKTLSARLKELESHGIITRKAYPEIPPRVEYMLSSKGRELFGVLTPLMEWAIKMDHEQMKKQQLMV